MEVSLFVDCKYNISAYLRGEEAVEILLYKPAWSHDYKFGVEILLNRMEIYKPA